MLLVQVGHLHGGLWWCNFVDDHDDDDEFLEGHNADDYVEQCPAEVQVDEGAYEDDGEGDHDE